MSFSAGATTAGGDTAATGFWSPHTSSIDYCEPNYAHTSHIVEPHNVWSSLVGLSLVGAFGLKYGNPTHEKRYVLIYTILILIGIGSACLHGTLHWFFQSSDELPMIYIVIGLFYAVVECEAPRGQPTYPWLPAALIALAAANTAIYYTFQHLYLAFIATYTIMTLGTTAGLARLLFYREKRRLEAKKLFWLGEMWYSLIGIPVWALDMLLCHHVRGVADALPGWLGGMTPHVIWHCAAGMGAYLLTLSCCCCRAEELGIPYTLRFVFGGIVPVVLVDEPNVVSDKAKNR